MMTKKTLRDKCRKDSDPAFSEEIPGLGSGQS